MLPIALIRLLIRRQLVGERSKRDVNFVSYFSFFLLLSCVDHNRAGLLQSSLGEPDSLGWFPMAVADCGRCKRSRGTRRHTRKLRAAPKMSRFRFCVAPVPRNVSFTTPFILSTLVIFKSHRGDSVFWEECVFRAARFYDDDDDFLMRHETDGEREVHARAKCDRIKKRKNQIKWKGTEKKKKRRGENRRHWGRWRAARLCAVVKAKLGGSVIKSAGRRKTKVIRPLFFFFFFDGFLFFLCSVVRTGYLSQQQQKKKPAAIKFKKGGREREKNEFFQMNFWWSGPVNLIWSADRHSLRPSISIDFHSSFYILNGINGRSGRNVESGVVLFINSN